MAYTHDVIVIGAGSAGLTAAGGCAMLGLKVALIERGEMGGDCLNTGCVPSKALIAAAARAEAVRDAARFGVRAGEPEVDFAAVHAHVHRAIATIAPVDSQERFEGLGVEVIRAEAKLLGDRRVGVAGRTLSAPRIVLATGSKPLIPDIPGLKDVPFLTNESVFDLTERPEHLLVVGAGPIGCELAQAFRRLGARVTILARGRPLPKDDPDAAAVVIERLEAEGVTIMRDAEAVSARAEGAGVVLGLSTGGEASGSHVLVAAGRAVDPRGLEIEAAGVHAGNDGIEVDARRRTSNKRIFAVGDCRAGPRFTHVSGYEGSLAVLNIALGLPSKVDYRALPWVTYTDPELAQVGLTEVEAHRRFGDKVSVWRQDFAHNDRAIAEGQMAGFVKVMKAGGKVVGATIVGNHAGEQLLPWTMAISGKSSTFGIAGLIVPYPTRAEASKAAAFASHEALIFSGAAKRWAALLAWVRRLR